MKAWTDYPIQALGDEAGEEAPIREVTVLGWDGNKYAEVEVEGIQVSFKAGYLYTRPGRLTDRGWVSKGGRVYRHPGNYVVPSHEIKGSHVQTVTPQGEGGVGVLVAPKEWDERAESSPREPRTGVRPVLKEQH